MTETGATRFPLRAKLVLVSAALAALPLALVGYRLVDVNEEAVTLLGRDLQLAVADDVARTIDQALDEAEDGLVAVARVLVDSELEPDARIALALALVEGTEALDHVAVHDARGELIDVVREESVEGLELDAVLDEALRGRAAADNSALGDAVLRGGAARVPVVVPLRGGGRVTGYAAALVSIAPVQERVGHVAAGRFHGLDDAVFVVDRHLRILAHPDPARVLQPAGAEGLFAEVGPEGLRAEMARSGEVVSSGGTRMVATLAAVRGRPWAVAVQVPEEVAYASLHRMRRIVVLTLLAVFALALGAGWLVARRITAPLAELTGFAADLAARRFDRRVEIATGDELRTLGRAMSRAAEELEASEERLEREAAIRADLGRYLPAELVDKVVRREQDMALGGSRLAVTVLFADVVSFTPLTEKLPPEDVVTVLNELFTILTGIIFRHGGTVDKFIGDCVMALWGAPGSQPDHAARALAAAEDMISWLEVGNAGWQERYGVTVRLAIGVNSGEAVVGNIGSESRMEYTAIGDVVNVAARLEAVARPQQVLLTAATRAAAGERFEFVDAGLHTLSGRAEQVQLYELVV